MNLKEFAVLGLINIAPFQADPCPRSGYWCTAQEIVDTLYQDDHYDRFLCERKVLGDKMTANRVGYVLRRLHAGFPIRGKQLVEKRRVNGVNQWRMTGDALSICIA